MEQNKNHSAKNIQGTKKEKNHSSKEKIIRNKKILKITD